MTPDGPVTVNDLRKEIIALKRKEKYHKYIINHMKAELRLAFVTLNRVKMATEKALDKEEEMDEILESRLERNAHMTHNGEHILYAGETVFDEWNHEYDNYLDLEKYNDDENNDSNSDDKSGMSSVSSVLQVTPRTHKLIKTGYYGP